MLLTKLKLCVVYSVVIRSSCFVHYRNYSCFSIDILDIRFDPIVTMTLIYLFTFYDYSREKNVL